MSNNFKAAIEFTLPWEAGRDRKTGKLREDGGLNFEDGAATKWGIFQKANPDLDVANLTLEDALGIYKTRYWDVFKSKAPSLDLDTVPKDYAVAMFDTGVNTGVNRAFHFHLTASKTKDPTKTLLGLRDKYYFDLLSSGNVIAKKSYKGWIARMNDLKKCCEIIQKDV
jgi:hypothetical protein